MSKKKYVKTNVKRNTTSTKASVKSITKQDIAHSKAMKDMMKSVPFSPGMHAALDTSKITRMGKVMRDVMPGKSSKKGL